MAPIIDIARAELKKLFYSPVAWLILIVFAFLNAVAFTDVFGMYVHSQDRGIVNKGLTWKIYANNGMGFHHSIPAYLYLFIPLLTMNILSRDIGTGAIKLLLSSPLTNRQIILGKYLSLVVFSFMLTVIIFLIDLYGLFTIRQVDVPVVLCGLLGIFLLCCTYAAIGLYLSSLTTYPIVAAIGTLCILFLLNYVSQVWQEVPFIRDVTYWLSLKGRTTTFGNGLLTSEDTVYFITVIAFFLGLTLIRLKGSRTKKTRTHLLLQYTVAIVLLMITAYITSRPSCKFYLDVTYSQLNTLSPESQKVMAKMDGDLKITTYSNLLDNTGGMAIPALQKKDADRFEQYTRFKPDIRLDYVYYYKKVPDFYMSLKYADLSEKQLIDTLVEFNNYSFDILPYSQIKDQTDLSGENYRFVRLVERGNGRKTFLRVFDDTQRFPAEGEITASLKRLVEDLPQVGFITGHGERGSNVDNERGYKRFTQDKTFRYSLINNGFDFENVSLMAPVPDKISILVLAEPHIHLSETELKHFNDYVNRGGNLLIAGEPGYQDIMNTVIAGLGIRFSPGQLYQPKESILPDILSLKAVKEAKWGPPAYESIKSINATLLMNGVTSLEVTGDSGFAVTPLFSTESADSWNELETTSFLTDSVVFNPAAGERKKTYVPVMALERQLKDKAQRIIITGDADWLGNQELRTSRRRVIPANFFFIGSAFYWLSGDIAPINTTREEPIDNSIASNRKAWKTPAMIIKWMLSLLLFASAILIWIKRRGR